MAINRSYNRYSFILKEEIKGYALEKKDPIGYCRIETRDSKAKMQLYIQGLKRLSKETKYKVYYMMEKENYLVPIEIGNLNIDEYGKGELKYEFDAYNIGNKGMSINKLSVVAIIVRGGNNNVTFISPLAGYKGKEYNWRMKIKEEVEPEPEPVEQLPEQPLEQPVEQLIEELSEEQPIEQSIEELREEPLEQSVEESEEPKLEQLSEESQLEEPLEQSEEQLPEQLLEQLVEPIIPIEDELESDGIEYQEEIVQQENMDTNTELILKQNILELNQYDNEGKLEGNSLAELFEEQENLELFSNQKAKWIKISVKHLNLLPEFPWEIVNLPEVVLAYKKHKHLILGVWNEKYMLGIPKEENEHVKNFNPQLIFGLKKCKNKKMSAEYILMKIENQEV